MPPMNERKNEDVVAWLKSLSWQELRKEARRNGIKSNKKKARLLSLIANALAKESSTSEAGKRDSKKCRDGAVAEDNVEMDHTQQASEKSGSEKKPGFTSNSSLASKEGWLNELGAPLDLKAPKDRGEKLDADLSTNEQMKRERREDGRQTLRGTEEAPLVHLRHISKLVTGHVEVMHPKNIMKNRNIKDDTERLHRLFMKHENEVPPLFKRLATPKSVKQSSIPVRIRQAAAPKKKALGCSSTNTPTERSNAAMKFGRISNVLAPAAGKLPLKEATLRRSLCLNAYPKVKDSLDKKCIMKQQIKAGGKVSCIAAKRSKIPVCRQAARSSFSRILVPLPKKNEDGVGRKKHFK